MRRHRRITAIAVQFAFEQGKQRRLARPVFANQADALIGIDGQIGLVEQDFVAALQRQVLNVNHDGTQNK